MKDQVQESIAELLRERMRGIENQYNRTAQEYWRQGDKDIYRLCEQLLEIFD